MDKDVSKDGTLSLAYSLDTKIASINASGWPACIIALGLVFLAGRVLAVWARKDFGAMTA